MPSERILVPVSETNTLRETVGYVVNEALSHAAVKEPALIRFVYIHSSDTDSISEEQREASEELLSRVSVWATEDAGDHERELTVETAAVGESDFIFSPSDIAALLESEAAGNDISQIVLDPEYDPGIGAPLLRSLEIELSQRTDASIKEAPVERATRRVPLLGQATVAGVGVLFGTAFVFYQILGGAFTPFDLVTGTISATIVAVTLSRVSLNRRPDTGMVGRLFRGLIYIPYLLYEIVVANLVIAVVILNPRLDIDPRMTRVRADVVGALPVTTLANSITLTPGTLTVRARGQSLVVHTLVPWARDGLFDGSLERAVRFVFYGRDSMAVPSPRERGEAEVLQRPDDGEIEADATIERTEPEADDTTDDRGER